MQQCRFRPRATTEDTVQHNTNDSTQGCRTRRAIAARSILGPGFRARVGAVVTACVLVVGATSVLSAPMAFAGIVGNTGATGATGPQGPAGTSALAPGTITTLITNVTFNTGFYGVVWDSAGNRYAMWSGQLFKTAPNGTTTTIGDVNTFGFSPWAVAIDANDNVFVAGSRANKVFKVDTSGTITTYAGTGARDCTIGVDCGYGGDRLSAVIGYPRGVAVDSSGNVYVVSAWQGRVLKIATDGTTTSYSETTGNCSADSCSIAFDSNDNLYIPYRFGAHRIAPNGTVTDIVVTLPGDDEYGIYALGVAVDPFDNLYVTGNLSHVVRQVTPGGRVFTVAGTYNTLGYTGDGGPATAAQLAYPSAVNTDASGNIYFTVVDPSCGCGVVRRVERPLAPAEAGATGPTGDTGATGATGPAGASGVAGPTGATGPRGSAGLAGPTGSTGASGPQGATGVAGAAGLQGATGPAGATGATGAAGATGVRGDTGLQGATGSAGVQGATGVAGAAGLQGATGPAGATGPTGATGATGAAGATGPKGDTGAAGAAGASGAQGVQGATGAAGAVGATGAQGNPGNQGDTGVSGSQGDTGVAGIGTLVAGVQQLRSSPRYAGPGMATSSFVTALDYPVAEMTLSLLYVKAYAKFTGTVTVMRNGQATELRCTMVAAKTCNDTLHSVHFDAGDSLNFRFAPVGNAHSARVVLSVRTTA